MRRHHFVMTVFLCAMLPLSSFADANPFPDYYKVSEKSLKPKSLFDPLQEVAEVMIASAEQGLDLLVWSHSSRALPEPSEKYNRKKHFGRWVNDPTDDQCWNTRAKVLIRDSEVPVTFKPGSDCVVEKGRWRDPYTGTTITEARGVQIDHFVPLKNSYISGGWKWEPLKKCMYANFLSNDFHLLAVDARENMSKGDDTPEMYMPPNDAFTCDYLQRWLKVKLIWSLAMQPGEALAIEDLLTQNHCPATMFKFSRAELTANRKAILNDRDQCMKMAQSKVTNPPGL